VSLNGFCMATTNTFWFLVGFVSCALLLFFSISLGTEIPFITGKSTAFTDVSPSDRIHEEDIAVSDKGIMISLPHASLSSYADTGSMKPLLHEGANGIRVVPEQESDIALGDIVSFTRDGFMVVHRVIASGVDEQGTYFITKGDNNATDDGKIRFSDIRYVTVGVLW
jgi:signal peptidase I